MIAPTLVAFPGLSVAEVRSMSVGEMRELWSVKERLSGNA